MGFTRWALAFAAENVDYFIVLCRDRFKLAKRRHQNIAFISLHLLAEQTLLICPSLTQTNFFNIFKWLWWHCSSAVTQLTGRIGAPSHHNPTMLPHYIIIVQRCSSSKALGHSCSLTRHRPPANFCAVKTMMKPHLGAFVRPVWPSEVITDTLKCQSGTLAWKQRRASALWPITGVGGRGLQLCWHLFLAFFLSRSTPSKGHRLIMQFTTVKIHIVEMSWHYYGCISRGIVIFIHWMMFNATQKTNACAKASIRQIYSHLRREEEPNTLLDRRVPRGCRLNSCLISQDCGRAVSIDGCDGGDNESNGSDNGSDRGHQRGVFPREKVIRGKEAGPRHCKETHKGAHLHH